MCPKCEAVWVKYPHQEGKHFVYRSRLQMRCPDCDRAIGNLFKTGRLEHRCKICGDAQVCETVQHAMNVKAKSAPAGAAGNEQAVMCDKCKTVWVYKPGLGNKGLIIRAKKQIVCPDCTVAAESSFGGKPLEKRCQSCGGTLSDCNVETQ